MAEAGIHHVTAIAGPASRNRTFYTRSLGLRLVKTTVNFDDPGTYHLYFGDEVGSPGTILTFFPIEGAAPGRVGAGETSETAFRVPRASLDFWTGRLAGHGAPCEPVTKTFGETVLRFKDPDGLNLALVGIEGDPPGPTWCGGGIPTEHAIRGLHGVTLLLHEPERTAAVLTGVLGFRDVGRDASSIRFASDAAFGNIVTVRGVGDLSRGRQGSGSVHHIAFRAADDAAQTAMTAKLTAEHRLIVTEQRDRCYFRSVYFREPGGVLFEIATDLPGFAIDEPADALGRTLKLPSFLEPRREQIERALPELG